ncbi:hypothetical protein DSO57_1016150 [Entomophthora muscae]|uniref:Uncharacterized protein n=1 Tax=Entomophthora muscae TaxID=34485 RepID=A0ACC2T534_9FUNG|nr:hypothetical protein DSO57_1016150 [Entomophthora muscae]
MMKIVFLVLGALASDFTTCRFNFTLQCNQPKAKCKQVENSLVLGAQFIENAIDIVNTITVQVNYTTHADQWKDIHLLGKTLMKF